MVKLIGCGAFEWNWKSLDLVWDVLEPGATGAFFSVPDSKQL